MNKRNRKKLLCKAIKELSNDFAKEFNLPSSTEEHVRETYKAIKDDKPEVRKVLSDYILLKQYGTFVIFLTSKEKRLINEVIGKEYTNG